MSRLVGTLSRRRARDLRRRAGPRRGPGRRGAADRQDQPGRRAAASTCALTDDSDLPRLDPEASTDVGTVLGNLVDNAVDAVGLGRRAGGRGRAAPRRRHRARSSGRRHRTRGPARPGRRDLPARLEHQGVRRPSGRGVGLALVQVVCERRGGAVTVRAGDDGTGAVFDARLPGVERSREPGRGGGAMRRAWRGARRRRRLHGRPHPHPVRRAHRRASGSSASPARGQAALADVERLRPDLVLLDVHLPDMTGIEVLRRLRAAGDDVGVLVVTAAREADTVRAAAAGGAAHYLVKPFDYDDLRVRLESFRAAHLAAVRRRPRPGSRTSTPSSARPRPAPAAPLPKGLSPRDGRRGRGGAAATAGELSAAECAERRRHLPGLGPPLPRALRRPRIGVGAPAVRRRRAPRAPLPPGRLSADGRTSGEARVAHDDVGHRRRPRPGGCPAPSSAGHDGLDGARASSAAPRQDGAVGAHEVDLDEGEAVVVVDREVDPLRGEVRAATRSASRSRARTTREAT